MFFYDIKGGDWRQSVNTFFATIAFLVCRDFMLFYSVFFIGLPWLIKVYGREKHSFLNWLLLFEFIFALVFNLLLNIYWSYLIAKQLQRIFTRGQEFAEGKFDISSDAQGPVDKQVELAKRLLDD